jgi:hypothetical protein
MVYRESLLCDVCCYLCNKECKTHMVYWKSEYFCSTECVSSYQTFDDMLDYFKEKNESKTID